VDLALEAREVWWKLRSLRANPPGTGGHASRHSTFCAAIEQSEQLFTAAAQVGYAARPLPLFYGLSQAGRALTACFELDDDSWLLRSHGIWATELVQPELWDTKLQDRKDGSFIRVAHVLDSPTLPQACRLGDVWATLPALSKSLPKDAYRARALRVERDVLVSRNAFGGSPAPAMSTALAPAWLYGLSPALEFSDLPEAAVAEELALYPSLLGFEELTSASPPNFHPAAVAGELGVRLVWKADGLTEQDRALRVDRMCLPTTDGSSWVAPAVSGNDRQLHPLVAWWAVLFALSMHARYEPAAWEQHRDIDSRVSASVIEVTLDTALLEVPRLLLAAFDS
jgi:hypothetical protein